MNAQEALNKSWYIESWLVSLFWFPPFGLVALYHAYQANRSLAIGEELEGLKRRVKTRIWLRRAILAGMVWLIVLAAYVFLNGGKVIPAMGTFY